MTAINDSLTLAQITRLLRATPQTLRIELDALPGEVLRWRPAPAEWCINEVIGHLIACDQNGFAGRIQTILAEEKPRLVAWDVAGTVAQRRDEARDGFELIAALEKARLENTEFIATLTPAQLARTGLHPAVGELQVRDLLFEWVHHDRNHMKQILSNVQAYIWPDLGNCRRFFEAELNPYL
jgi:hypothetical protein